MQYDNWSRGQLSRNPLAGTKKRMQTVQWHILFERRQSSHRWIYLAIAIFYGIGMIPIMAHPFTESSLYVPYIVLAIVPVFIMLVHFFISRLVTWWIVIILYIVIYCTISIQELTSAWYGGQGSNLEPSDFYSDFALTLCLFALGIWILYITRPRQIILKSAS